MKSHSWKLSCRLLSMIDKGVVTLTAAEVLENMFETGRSRDRS